jgi:hypothetical protein
LELQETNLDFHMVFAERNRLVRISSSRAKEHYQIRFKTYQTFRGHIAASDSRVRFLEAMAALIFDG